MIASFVSGKMQMVLKEGLRALKIFRQNFGKTFPMITKDISLWNEVCIHACGDIPFLNGKYRRQRQMCLRHRASGRHLAASRGGSPVDLGWGASGSIWGSGRHLGGMSVAYTHLRAHETREVLVCRLLLEKKKYTIYPASHLNTIFSSTSP